MLTNRSQWCITFSINNKIHVNNLQFNLLILGGFIRPTNKLGIILIRINTFILLMNIYIWKTLKCWPSGESQAVTAKLRHFSWNSTILWPQDSKWIDIYCYCIQGNSLKKPLLSPLGILRYFDRPFEIIFI